MTEMAAAALPGVGWSARTAEWVVESPQELCSLLSGLGPGDRCYVAGTAPWSGTLRETKAGVWWFPLEPEAGMWRALAECPREDAGLAAYLAREHRLIERAWAGAPGGQAFRWRLERHMQVEERILFPAWEACGERPGWARGLAAEHGLLRRPVLNSRIHLRAFRRHLDAHGEKEERVFYPALIDALGAGAAARLLREAMLVSP